MSSLKIRQYELIQRARPSRTQGERDHREPGAIAGNIPGAEVTAPETFAPKAKAAESPTIPITPPTTAVIPVLVLVITEATAVLPVQGLLVVVILLLLQRQRQLQRQLQRLVTVTVIPVTVIPVTETAGAENDDETNSVSSQLNSICLASFLCGFMFETTG